MKLFIKEQIPYIVLYVFQFVFLYLAFRWLHADMVRGNLAYLFLVSLFLLAVYMAYRYLTGRSAYKWLSGISERNEVKSFLRLNAPSPLFHAFKEALARQYRLLQSDKENAVKETQERIDFMNRFVHLMKTPLAALRLITQDLEDRDEAADELQAEIDRMEYNLNMILTLSRLASFRRDFRIQPIALKSLAVEAVNELKNSFIRHRLFPSVEVASEIAVRSDRKWLKFTLLQLLSNAIRYSDGANRRVTVIARREDERIVLSVQDEGVGIPSEDLPRVFDLYYTGSNGRKFGESTGIGLYMVRNICDELEHQVLIRSAPGQGTNVSLWLPAADNGVKDEVTNL